MKSIHPKTDLIQGLIKAVEKYDQAIERSQTIATNEEALQHIKDDLIEEVLELSEKGRELLEA